MLVGVCRVPKFFFGVAHGLIVEILRVTVAPKIAIYGPKTQFFVIVGHVYFKSQIHLKVIYSDSTAQNLSLGTQIMTY